MKHEVKITSILLAMFILTQLIGLYVIDAYTPTKTIHVGNTTQIIGKNITMPYGTQPPEIQPQISLLSIVISLIIAVGLFFLLTKLRSGILLKAWFILVVFICLAEALFGIISKLAPGFDATIIALLIALPLTFYKSIKPNMIVHNTTELLIYPGLAAVFVPILRTWSIIILLLLISVYDMWAVWKSTLMVNLAKYQINTLKVFTGFFIPYLPKGMKLARKGKGKKVKVSVALLGGGDVAFPLIFAGVIYQASGLIPALIIVAGATLSLMLLFMYSKKGKFYPAMPFITAGCLIAYVVSLIV
jgi:presenilin-like A22 family membrane protease